jgi:hypothetical protein
LRPDADGQIVVDIRKFAVQRLALSNSNADPVAGWLYSLAWRRRDRDGKAAAEPGTSLILSAAGARGELLRDALTARGERCVSGSPQALPELLREVSKAARLHRVVYLAEEPAGESDPAAFALAKSVELLHVAQTLAQGGFRDTPRLWLVTRGAQAISATDKIDGLGLSALWGLARWP